MPAITHVRVQHAVVVSSVAALALVACGEGVPQTPAQRVENATSSVLDTESLTVSVGLDLDAESRAAIAALATETLGSSGETGAPAEMTPTVVERLLESRIVTTVATTDGTTLSDVDLSGVDFTTGTGLENVSTSVSFVVEGDALVETRQVAGTLHVRVDAAGLEKALEQPGLVDEMTASMDDVPPAMAEAVEALAAGQWVSVDTADLSAEVARLAGEFQQFGRPTPGETSSPSESAAPDAGAVSGAVRKLFDDAVAVVKKEIVVTESGEDAYTVVAPLDRIVAGLEPSLKTALAEIIAQMGTPVEDFDAEFESGMAEVTEALEGRSARLDVTLDGERLSTVRLDVTQFLDDVDREDLAEDGVTGLPVLVELGYEGGVQAPQDAVELDVTSMMEEMTDSFLGMGDMAGLEGLDGLEGTTPGDPGTAGDPGSYDPFEGVTAEDLGMTEEEFEAFKVEMGVVPTP